MTKGLQFQIYHGNKKRKKIKKIKVILSLNQRQPIILIQLFQENNLTSKNF